MITTESAKDKEIKKMRIMISDKDITIGELEKLTDDLSLKVDYLEELLIKKSENGTVYDANNVS